MADAAKVCLTSNQKEKVNIAKKAFKIMITASWAVDLTEDSSTTAHGRALWVRGVHASGFLLDGLRRQWGSVPWEWSPVRPDALLFYPQSSGSHGSHVSQQAIWGRGDWQVRRAFQRVLPFYFWCDCLNSHSHYLNSYKRGVLSLRDVIRGERLYPFFKELRLYKKENYW